MGKQRERERQAGRQAGRQRQKETETDRETDRRTETDRLSVFRGTGIAIVVTVHLRSSFYTQSVLPSVRGFPNAWSTDIE